MPREEMAAAPASETVKMPQPVDIEVGRRIYVRRKQMRLSQERLGQLVGVSFQQVQKYEMGRNRIGASRLLQLAAALEVPVIYFFPPDTTPMPASVDVAAKLANIKARLKGLVEEMTHCRSSFDPGSTAKTASSTTCRDLGNSTT